MKKFILVSLIFLLILCMSIELNAVTVTIGSGTTYNTATGSPTPYGTYYKNFRLQYLLSSEELNSAGGGGGNITALSFNVFAVNSCSSMPNYRLRMKQTTATSFSSTAFETGTYTEVWNSANYTPIIGWNLHTFSTPFMWDGSSNIIVDIVTTMIPGSITQNSSVYNTASTSTCKYFQSNTVDAGTYTGTGTTVSSGRANIKLEMAAIPFTEITTASLTGLFDSSIAWGDYDNDGDLDVINSGFASGGGTGVTTIYRNNGNNTFTDINAGLTGVGYSSVAWGDYDNDGDLDILINGWTGGTQLSKIYRNNGNDSFTDISAGLLGLYRGSVAWGDYDNDGDLDILITGVVYGSFTRYSKIYRNDGIDTFVDISANIIGVFISSAVWGDYDNDGDLDILLSGQTSLPPGEEVYVSKIYRNDGNSTFTDLNVGLIGVGYSSVDWGDYDNDGYLDILLSGQSGTAACISRVYRNNGNGVFTDINAGLIGLGISSKASNGWSDYDNDGDLDILLAGYSGSSCLTNLYRNNGNNSFTNITTSMTGVDCSSVAWGDYDNDGDADIIITGRTNSHSYITKIYRNNSSVVNDAPSAPTNLRTSINGNSIIFAWDASSDTHTPSIGLNYVLRIGTTPGGSQISVPMSSTAGFRRIAQNGYVNGACFWKINASVLANHNNYWSVQALDGAYKGSAFAQEVMVDVRLIEIMTNSPVDFGSTYLSSQSAIQNILLRNNGMSPLSITSFDLQQPDSPFEVMGITLPLIVEAGNSAAIPVRFTPQTAGTVTDSLFIYNNSVNMPRVGIRLTGTGQYVPPQPPDNVQITMNGNSAIISWDAVTQTIFDTPITPDYYLIFFNGSGDVNGQYYYLDWSDTLNYTHRRVGLHSAFMFYHVVAFKEFADRDFRNVLCQLTNVMTEAEVMRILK